MEKFNYHELMKIRGGINPPDEEGCKRKMCKSKACKTGAID